MSHFATDLETRDIDELKGLFQLRSPLVYYSDLLACKLTVPEGFISDGNSIPRIPFAYDLLGGKGKKAAVLHDFLYSGGRVCGQVLERKECDRVFAEALRACGYSALVVSLMHAGVRLGGASHWSAPNVRQLPHVAALMA